MKPIKVLLAFASSGVQDKFLERMKVLRGQIGGLPEVEMLPNLGESIVPAEAGSNTPNGFAQNMARVRVADLVVWVHEHDTEDMVMGFMKRCQSCQPILIFHHHKRNVSQSLVDCLVYYRSQRFASPALDVTEMPDPIRFISEDDIFKAVADWIQKRRELETARAISNPAPRKK